MWWRACVIWRNKIVYCVGLLLVTFTLGMLYSGSFPTLFRGSVSSASQADSPNVLVIVGYRSTQVIPTTAIAILATDNIYIKAAGTVSLTTNALATALIAFKAWYVAGDLPTWAVTLFTVDRGHALNYLGNTDN